MPHPSSAVGGVFRLPTHLARKADPALVADDERHFAAVADAVAHAVADLAARLDEARRTAVRAGQAALDRDQEVHRLTARLRVLERFGLDACLGRMVPADGGPPVYVGRVGLTDADGRRLLVDWRSPTAEPFFAATRARPAGLASRRRYRWADGYVVDYWDEVLADDAADPAALAPDADSAFLASLAGPRTGRMRDVLATLQADQDAIVRAPADGALVVDGGPGTGKTVVALHRVAYLQYADPRVGARRGGVLVVGPHRPYLDYVADVLPGLGEEGVRVCTLRDLVPEGADARPEPDPEVARLKASARMVDAIEPAVAFYERPPREPVVVGTPWADVTLGPAEWAEAYAAVDPGTPHNEAREAVWQALLDVVVDALADEAGDVPPDAVRRAVAGGRDLRAALGRAWPALEPTDLVGDLWTVPAYLRLCAPWLTPEEVARLQRPTPDAWTDADLPLLDAARRRLGDPEAWLRRRRAERAAAAERAQRADVADDLIASDDSEMLVMSMLRAEDLRAALDEAPAEAAPRRDPLAGPFAHVVVDEAQELTDAQWRMLLGRCPSGSLTVVGDRAQARRPFAESWAERLARVGVRDVAVRGLTVNYRTPVEVMAEAEPVIRAVLPDANVPTSVRSSGIPVARVPASEVRRVVEAWAAKHPEGTACVVGDPTFPGTERVRSLAPEEVKGLEFDLVVLVEPADPADDGPADARARAVDRYVTMTRATERLVVATRPDESGRRARSVPA